jgi:peroxiredoxin
MKASVRWVLGMLLTAVLVFPVSTGALPAPKTILPECRADENIAPDFVLKDLNGREVRMSQFKGRVVFLVFGTTWCPQCREDISLYKDIYSRYSSKGLVVLAIDVLESQKKAAAFAKRHDLPYPVLLDSNGKVMSSYGVLGVPVKILIDRSGRIICWNCRSLEALLKKQF